MLSGLQYARGIAALLVVLFHSGPYLPSQWVLFTGHRGVDIFFVISGFIMSMVVRRESADRLDFLARRIIRIVPLYWIILLWVNRGSLRSGQGWDKVLLDMFFIPYATEGSPFIAPTFHPGWTLNYEMFFYVVLALCMGLRHRSAVVCALLIGLSLCGAAVRPSVAAMEFYTTHYLSLFALGMLLEPLRLRLPSVPPTVAAAGIAVCVLLVLGLPDSRWTPLTVGLPAGATVLLCASLKEGLSLRLPLLLGNASYSIYLFHQQGMGLTGAALRNLGLLDAGAAPAVISGLTVVAGGIAWGVVVYVLLEKPMLGWMTRKWKGWRAASLSPSS
jgi:exopolysaccharide production protein ExoZ